MKPDAVAFKFMGNVSTWKNVAENMDSFAAALQRRGVALGDRVLLLRLTGSERWLFR